VQSSSASVRQLRNINVSDGLSHETEGMSGTQTMESTPDEQDSRDVGYPLRPTFSFITCQISVIGSKTCAVC
jgi:hypothetical protein